MINPASFHKLAHLVMGPDFHYAECDPKTNDSILYVTSDQLLVCADCLNRESSGLARFARKNIVIVDYIDNSAQCERCAFCDK